MGGHMQPQGHVQVMISTIDDGSDPQAALGEPRWYWHTGRDLRIEPGLRATEAGRAAVAGLRRRGHEVSVAEDVSGFGFGQAIWRLPDSAGHGAGHGAGYVAGTEPRADGCAAAY
jgi:gamma-glutamyltranspeptidase / glutathione hydrolase